MEKYVHGPKPVVAYKIIGNIRSYFVKGVSLIEAIIKAEIL